MLLQSHKSVLAKLLAKENITVEQNPVSTASFNLDTRTLVVPIWENLTDNTYNMLIGHEVSHALNTPRKGWHTSVTVDNIPKTILNIVEDARIERLIMEKYPGMAITFPKGYRDLLKVRTEIFSKPESLKALDRLNAKAKLRSLLKLELNEEEQYFYDRMLTTETWEDVVQLSKEIFEWLKRIKKTVKEQDDIKSSESSSESGDRCEDVELDDNDLESLLDDALREFEMEVKNTQQIHKTLYISYDEKNFTILRESEIHFKEGPHNVERVYKSFLEVEEGIIKVMSNEFNRKKAACQFSRTLESTTGDLDLNKLVNYKTSDDIFVRNQITPDALDHGMIILLDLSISMSYILSDMTHQACIFAEFCKRVGVSLKIFGFTHTLPSSNSPISAMNIELYNSSSPNSKQQLANLLSFYSKGYYQINNPGDYGMQESHYRYRLIGTPTFGGVMALEKELLELVKTHQKSHFVLMTDGHMENFIGNENRAFISFLGKSKTVVKKSETTSNFTVEDVFRPLIEIMKDKGVTPTAIYMTQFPIAKAYPRVISTFRENNKSVKDIPLPKGISQDDKFYIFPESYQPLGFENVAIINNIDKNTRYFSNPKSQFKSKMRERSKVKKLATYFADIFS